MFHKSKLMLSICVLVYCVFVASLSFAQPSDEEYLQGRVQPKSGKNIAQKIIAVPTAMARFPFYITGKGIKHTAIFIDDIALIPRARALLTSDDGLIALYPTVMFGGRTGLGAELNFFNKRFLEPGNKLSLQASYSTNSHQNHFIRYKIPDLAGSFFLDMSFGYNLNTNEDFYGIGNDADDEARTNFEHEKLGGRLAAGVELKEWLRTRFHVDYADH